MKFNNYDCYSYKFIMTVFVNKTILLILGILIYFFEKILGI